MRWENLFYLFELTSVKTNFDDTSLNFVYVQATFSAWHHLPRGVSRKLFAHLFLLIFFSCHFFHHLCKVEIDHQKSFISFREAFLKVFFFFYLNDGLCKYLQSSYQVLFFFTVDTCKISSNSSAKISCFKPRLHFFPSSLKNL